MTSEPRIPQVLTVDDRAHSPVGPSSFERAEACPASVLSAGRVSTASVWADEGTTAHALFEAVLASGGEAYEWLGAEVRTPAGALLGTVDLEMLEGVDLAVEAVLDLLHPDFTVEGKLHMPAHLSPRDYPMFGYVDVLGRLRAIDLPAVVDLKYGMTFVPADAVQLGLYALMHLFAQDPDGAPAYRTLPASEPVATTLVIQPRLPNPVRSAVWTAGDMRRLEARVAAVRDSLDRIPPAHLRYAAGSHCRWCARAAACPHLRAFVTDAAAARMSVDPEAPVTAAMLDASYRAVAAAKAFVEATEAAAEAYLKAGGVMTEAKLIRGRGSRDWKDAEDAVEFLTAHGVDPWQKPALLSPAQAEKALPKPAKAQVPAHVASVQGKIRLAPMSDPAEAVTTTEGIVNAALAMTARNLLKDAAE